MKKLLQSLFGSSQPEIAQPRIELVDPSAIRGTMPSVAVDQLEFEAPTQETFEVAPQFHEDEWRQVEFFPQDRLASLKVLFSEYKAFEVAQREDHGWRRVFPRQLPPLDVLAVSVADLAAFLNGVVVGAPILFISSKPLGQVKRGFSISLAQNVFLYGIEDRGAITVLAAMLQGGDDFVLTQAFMQLNRAHLLFLIDWRSQTLLQEVEADGNILVWHP